LALNAIPETAMPLSNRPSEPTRARQGARARAALVAGLVLVAVASPCAGQASGAASGAGAGGAANANGAAASAALAASTLHIHFDRLHDQLANNQFGRPLVMESTQHEDRLVGEVFARIDEPFPAMSATLQGTAHWCSILVLHLNVKRCHADADGLDMALGRKYDQPADDAYQLHFQYHLEGATSDYLKAGLSAHDGPLGTHDYDISVEATPLDAQHTIIHMSYAYGVGAAARFATGAYLATTGADKVGFSIDGKEADGQPKYTGGVRGLIERNTMRYYLAIESYAKYPAPDQLDKRLADWFDATEHYPRQLHEMEKDAYISMKREEVKR
jgi:hypothetical protein